MKLQEFLDEVRDLPPDTLLCVAEVDEAFGMNVTSVEQIGNARAHSHQADGNEAVELGNGDEKVLVLRW